MKILLRLSVSLIVISAFCRVRRRGAGRPERGAGRRGRQPQRLGLINGLNSYNGLAPATA